MSLSTDSPVGFLQKMEAGVGHFLSEFIYGLSAVISALERSRPSRHSRRSRLIQLSIERETWRWEICGPPNRFACFD